MTVRCLSIYFHPAESHPLFYPYPSLFNSLAPSSHLKLICTLLSHSDGIMDNLIEILRRYFLGPQIGQGEDTNPLGTTSLKETTTAVTTSIAWLLSQSAPGVNHQERKSGSSREPEPLDSQSKNAPRQIEADLGSPSRQSPQVVSIKTKLNAFPTEVLIEIATLLGPVDRACLAMTCRRTHLMMMATLNLNPATDRWEFLRRLEADHVSLDKILCQGCCKFHAPRKYFPWTMQQANRPCVNHGISDHYVKCQSSHLPSELHWDLVAAIMRRHRHDPKRLSQARHTSMYSYRDGEVLISSQISLRVCQTHLVMKREIFFQIGKKTNVSRKVRMLKKIIDGHRELKDICHHTRWIKTENWPLVVTHDAAEYWTISQGNVGSQLRGYNLPAEFLQKCLWKHERTCWTRCIASPRLDNSLLRLGACKHCPTDYQITCLRSGGGNKEANTLVLTVWKNLGQGIDINDENWLQHVDPRLVERPIYGETIREFGMYEAAKYFEGHGEGNTKFVYRPIFTPRADGSPLVNLRTLLDLELNISPTES